MTRMIDYNRKVVVCFRFEFLPTLSPKMLVLTSELKFSDVVSNCKYVDIFQAEVSSYFWSAQRLLKGLVFFVIRFPHFGSSN